MYSSQTNPHPDTPTDMTHFTTTIHHGHTMALPQIGSAVVMLLLAGSVAAKQQRPGQQQQICASKAQPIQQLHNPAGTAGSVLSKLRLYPRLRRIAIVSPAFL